MLSLFAGILAWWVVLTRESRHVAQQESDRQTHLLMQEIEAHRKTDEQLQKAKEASGLPMPPRVVTLPASPTSCALRSTASSDTRKLLRDEAMAPATRMRWVPSTAAALTCYR